nr:uroporphyrinogen decarboxylase family protein [Sedimentibacter sp.]
MLSEKDRLEKVMSKEAVDRPPCICPGGMMNMITVDLMEKINVSWPEAHINSKMMADLASAVYDQGCFENYGVPFCMTIEAEEMGADVIMGSKIYEPHVTGYAIESVLSWNKLNPVNFEQGRTKTVLDAIKLLKDKNDDVPIIGNIIGPISGASSVIEPVVFYKELKKHNKEAHEFLNFVTEQIIIFAKKQIEAGADVIALSDPSGTGEILGPKYFEEFAVKYINQIIEEIQKYKVRTIVHICGQMKNVYAQASKIKSDVLSFDSIVSIQDAKKNLPGRVIMGNVSTYALEFSTPDKIKALTNKCVEAGSDIISPACGLGTKSPLQNIQAMLSELRKQGGALNA